MLVSFVHFRLKVLTCTCSLFERCYLIIFCGIGGTEYIRLKLEGVQTYLSVFQGEINI